MPNENTPDPVSPEEDDDVQVPFPIGTDQTETSDSPAPESTTGDSSGS